MTPIDIYKTIYAKEFKRYLKLLYTDDKASILANIYAVKNTWKHYNLLKGLKWNTHLLNKTFKGMVQLDIFH